MSSHKYDPKVMEWFAYWHQRMVHASLTAILTASQEPYTGMEPPPNLPTESELDPYLNNLECRTCAIIYGSACGPRPDQE